MEKENDISGAIYFLAICLLLHGCGSGDVKPNIYINDELANPSTSYCEGKLLGERIREGLKNDPRY